MKSFVVVFGLLITLIACSNGIIAMGDSDEKNTELEIRAAICEIENGNFKAAQSRLESVLKKDPKNIYALRLLPGITARQIRKDDKSPANVAQIRKAIDDYERAVSNPLLKSERAEINDFIITLYGFISNEEKSIALLRKAENPSEEPKQRAVFYASLAAENYACANDISDVSPVKSTVKRNGREVYVFRKPQNPADFERLKKCAAKGSELIGRAIALDPRSETAWIYRASLAAQLARIAEMEGKPAEKARQLKEFDAAREKFNTLSRTRIDEQTRKDTEPFAKTLSDSVNFSSTGLTDAQFKELSQELKTYRVEKSLAETIERVYIPFGLVNLIAPVAPEDNPSQIPDDATKSSGLNDEKANRGWKIFSQEDGLSAELPPNVGVSLTSDSRLYTANGNGLSFYILEMSESRELSDSEQDIALNIYAWILTKYVANTSVGQGAWNDRFESELIRKDKLGGNPARFYAYRVISCKETTEGMMLFVLGKKKNYAIDIRGANESDERVQRFLKSLKLG